MVDIMKNSIPFIVAVAAAFLPVMSFAEGGGGDQDWAEKAAVGYEYKAAKALEDDKAQDATIYTRMAQIKRDAGAAGKEGKSFSWDEYHALNGQLSGNSKPSGDKNKVAKDKEKYAKGEAKEKSADKKAHFDKKGKQSPAEGFIKTATEYQQKSIEATKAGDTEKANIYLELAKMKLDAASAVGQGKDYDWTQYHQLVKSLEK